MHLCALLVVLLIFGVAIFFICAIQQENKMDIHADQNTNKPLNYRQNLMNSQSEMEFIPCHKTMIQNLNLPLQSNFTEIHTSRSHYCEEHLENIIYVLTDAISVWNNSPVVWTALFSSAD